MIEDFTMTLGDKNVTRNSVKNMLYPQVPQGLNNVKNLSPSGLSSLNRTVPFFGEISDPIRPCYIYLCIPAPGNSFTWVERFTHDRCCQFESRSVQIGRKIVMDPGSERDPCMETEVSCELPAGYEPTTLPKILVERKQVRWAIVI